MASLNARHRGIRPLMPPRALQGGRVGF